METFTWPPAATRTWPLTRRRSPPSTSSGARCAGSGSGVRGAAWSSSRSAADVLAQEERGPVKRPLPGKRRTCRVCYTPPASAATARGDVAAGRRGRIADMTTVMLPADLAAVSSLPLVGQRAAPPCRLCVAVDGEFVAAGRRGTAGSCASPSLVFSCPGRVACGAPAGAQIRAHGRERSCRWPCRAVGGRASGVDVAAGPRSASQPGRGNRARAVAGLSGQPDDAHRASEASPASEPFRLVEPQLV
jgi:hypothetical protein